MLFVVSPAVNFINILRANFLYERRFDSFSPVICTSKKAVKQWSYEKFVHKMLIKLTPGNLILSLMLVFLTTFKFGYGRIAIKFV
jgi:hypothetical protein